MSESFELLVGNLHLVILSIEEDRLFDLIDIVLVNVVVTNTEVFYAEVGF